MREDLQRPTEVLSEDQLARARAYLEGQSRIALAVWVAHEQRGATGPSIDHHLMLGIPDELWALTDAFALELGLENEAPFFGWVDLFPLSEVEAIREISFVVWEGVPRPPEDLDPLAFRLSYEPIETSPELVAAVRESVQDVPSVLGVCIARQRLWNGDREVTSSTSVSVITRGHGVIGNDVQRLQAAVGEFFPGSRSFTYAKARNAAIPATGVFDRLTEDAA